MIYVDSNVPMYLVGAEHPNKVRVIELAARLVSAREPLVTSVETFQEIVHRYMRLRDRRLMAAAYGALEAMVTTVADVTKADVDRARALSAEYRELSSRDCVHIAVMTRIGCATVWTYDAGLAAVPTIERIE